MVGGMTYRTGMTYRHTHQHTDTHMFGGRGVRRNTTRGGALATGGGDAGGTRAMSDSLDAGQIEMGLGAATRMVPSGW